MKRIYRYLLTVALTLAFLVPGLSLADNNFQQPVKKSMQINHAKTQIVHNNSGGRPAHRSLGYIKKKKNDNFSHLNN